MIIKNKIIHLIGAGVAAIGIVLGGTYAALAQEINLEQIAEIKSLAAKGDPDYQTALGQMYLQGIGVEQDINLGKEWLEKAVSQDSAAAQYNMGIMYLEGIAVAQDYVVAHSWIEKAANNGDPSAQYNLAIFYEEGLGVESNTETAKKWFKKSCDAGIQEGCEAYKDLSK